MLALREFHHRHPEHDIHLFGDPGVTVPFPATNHGKVTPARLAELYNECVAGIAISFTNVSLVPDELLACGAIPVTCESEYARASLDNPFVRWAAPTPYALAESLSDVVSGNAAPLRSWLAASATCVGTPRNARPYARSRTRSTDPDGGVSSSLDHTDGASASCSATTCGSGQPSAAASPS
ncbi:hypothetical protein ACFQX7_08400 [Luedemannella flava]